MIEQDIMQAESRRPWSARKRSDRRDAIVPVPRVLQRRLAFRCPNASSQWLQQIATFIEKNQASFTFEALFLSAANRRGSNGRCRVRFVRERVVRASVDSSRVDAASAARTAGDTRLRTSAGSDRAPTDRSNLTAHSPRREFPCPTRLPMHVAVPGTVSALGRDGASGEACPHASRRCASDAPTKRSNPRLRQLRSSSFPARTIGPQFSDEVQAFRDFHVVSFPYCSGLIGSFH